MGVPGDALVPGGGGEPQSTTESKIILQASRSAIMYACIARMQLAVYTVFLLIAATQINYDFQWCTNRTRKNGLLLRVVLSDTT